MEPCTNLYPHRHEEKLGCSRASHYALGWCSGACSPHTVDEEVMGWRLLHLDKDHEHGDGPGPGTGHECPQHNPIQHRDGKPPWCRRCGRDGMGNLIGKIRSWRRP